MARYFLLVSILFLSGCFIQLSLNKMPVQPGETIQIKANLEIPVETANYKFKLTGAKVGMFNHIMIYVGEALVKYALTYIDTEDAGDNNVILRITIDNFQISGMTAFLETRFVITENNEIIFEENYLSHGEKYTAVWGHNPVLRKTTDDALSSAFHQFVDDISSSDYTDPKLKKILITDEWVNQ